MLPPAALRLRNLTTARRPHPRPRAVPAARVAPGAVAALSSKVAIALAKPERYVMVALATDRAMSFGGSAEPCAYAELVSVGGFRDTRKLSADLTPALAEGLGVAPERLYLKFTAVAGADFGWNGSTF